MKLEAYPGLTSALSSTLQLSSARKHPVPTPPRKGEIWISMQFFLRASYYTYDQ